MATQQLTKQGFSEKIFDFENETEWKYKGKLPAIIDFYADWCGPCRSVAPTLEALSEEYKGRIDIYKIDTEKEIEDKEFNLPKDIELKPMKEMANMFGGMGMPRGGQ